MVVLQILFTASLIKILQLSRENIKYHEKLGNSLRILQKLVCPQYVYRTFFFVGYRARGWIQKGIFFWCSFWMQNLHFKCILLSDCFQGAINNRSLFTVLKVKDPSPQIVNCGVLQICVINLLPTNNLGIRKKADFCFASCIFSLRMEFSIFQRKSNVTKWELYQGNLYLFQQALGEYKLVACIVAWLTCHSLMTNV